MAGRARAYHMGSCSRADSAEPSFPFQNNGALFNNSTAPLAVELLRAMDSLLQTLQSKFRLVEFRPRQREIIEDVLAGRDTLCVMPTGAGKSLCFQLPAVMLGGLTIVISPLISLMADQVRQLKQLGIPALILNSTQTPKEQRAIIQHLV